MKNNPLTIKPVYLCGFMGCGKSYYGQTAKMLLNCNYEDLDVYIEKTLNMTIPEIFVQKGADYFREAEYKALKTFAGRYLISLGGGALTYRKTAVFAKENANVIFIDTDFEICFERIKDDPNRPNAYGKSKDELYSLYMSRIETYKQSANKILSTEEEIIAQIKDFLKE